MSISTFVYDSINDDLDEVEADIRQARYYLNIAKLQGDKDAERRLEKEISALRYERRLLLEELDDVE